MSPSLTPSRPPGHFSLRLQSRKQGPRADGPRLTLELVVRVDAGRVCGFAEIEHGSETDGKGVRSVTGRLSCAPQPGQYRVRIDLTGYPISFTPAEGAFPTSDLHATILLNSRYECGAVSYRLQSLDRAFEQVIERPDAQACPAAPIALRNG